MDDLGCSSSRAQAFEVRGIRRAPPLNGVEMVYVYWLPAEAYPHPSLQTLDTLTGVDQRYLQKMRHLSNSYIDLTGSLVGPTAVRHRSKRVHSSGEVVLNPTGMETSGLVGSCVQSGVQAEIDNNSVGLRQFPGGWCSLNSVVNACWCVDRALTDAQYRQLQETLSDDLMGLPEVVSVLTGLPDRHFDIKTVSVGLMLMSLTDHIGE